MPLFLSHIAVKIWGLCSVYIVYGAKMEVSLVIYLEVIHYFFLMITSFFSSTSHKLETVTYQFSTISCDELNNAIYFILFSVLLKNLIDVF